MKETIAVIKLIIQSDPILKGKIRYNLFTDKLEVKGLSMTEALFYIHDKYEIKSRQKLDDAIVIVASENAYHPIKDYLNSLEWDGELRIENLLIDYLGAEDTEWPRVAIKKCLVTAVKLIFEPSCIADEMLLLIGPGGCGKSMFINQLMDIENPLYPEYRIDSWVKEVNDVNYPGCTFIDTSNGDSDFDITSRLHWPVRVSVHKKNKRYFEFASRPNLGRSYDAV